MPGSILTNLPFSAVFSLLLFSGTLCPGILRAGPVRSANEIRILSPTEIERSLLEWANRTRIDEGLKPLRPLAHLTAAARLHSRDMASRGRTDHISGDGRTFADRLMESGVYFVESGENVAFSETFLPEFIHESFMASPDHRDNLMNPLFDRAGMGVTRLEGKGFYITQNFIQALEPEDGFEKAGKELSPSMTAEPASTWHRILFEARLRHHLDRLRTTMVQDIDRLRRGRGLVPIEWIDRINDFADELASRRLGGRELPPVPEDLGLAHVIFVSAPSRKLLLEEMEKIPLDEYAHGGMGIRFGRDADHPGGSFFLTMVLLIESRFGNMTYRERRRLLLEEIQSLRTGSDLPPLKLDERLSKTALKISREIRSAHRVRPLSPALGASLLTSYLTRDLLLLPINLRSQLLRRSVRRIGIGIAFQEDSDLPLGRFWVTVIFR